MASRTLLDPGTRHAAVLAGGVCLLPLLLQLPPAIGGAVAASAFAVAALAWRRPVPQFLRLLLALAAIGAVLSLAGFRLGRDTGAALLAAMIAIKPAETFVLRDARSLVGFGLFAPFATFLLDQGPLTLALALVAVLFALATLHRLADVESGDATVDVLSTRTARSVGRLVMLGLPLALAAFWLFPRLGTPLWGVPDRALARPGLSDEMRPGEWLDLLADDSPALRVDFDGAVPPMQAMYWRGPVLWRFDGEVWTAPRELRALPPAPVDPGAAPRWRYTVAIEPTDRRQLVALDLPLAAPTGASMAIDRAVYAARPLSSLTRWRFESAPVESFQPDLPPDLRALALQLPTGFNPRTLALGRQWRREAGRDDAAIVRRALAWIRAEFAYTLEAPPIEDRASIDAFLFGYQAGYCEHFSSSFVVLMRAAGIPARVVTGYVGGYRNPIGGYWIVRRMDAHAWAEVWLPGRGWTRVDPTSAVAPERVYDTIEDRASTQGLLGGFGSDAPLRDVGDWLRRGWNDFVLGFDAQRQDRMLQWLGIEQLGAARLGALFAGACALALIVMLWVSARGPRETDPLLRAWHRLGARYARLGLDRAPHEPATDWAARVARARPDLAESLLALTRRFTGARYASGHTADDRAALIRDLHAHRPSRRSR